MSSQKRIVVIGAGLAGLSCALELADRGLNVLVLEAKPYVGGRTANWNENGMEVESGFHRFIGYYQVLPRLLEKAGIDLNKMIMWEEQMEVRAPDVEAGIFGVAPVYGPWKMIRSIIGNNHIISPLEKASLTRFFIAGFKDFFMQPQKLDQYNLLGYAKKHHVQIPAIRYLLVPLSTGLYFQPIEEYSALAFFGLFAPGIPRLHKMRIGAFKGGMSDVMCQPMATAIEEKGGKIKTNTPVHQLLFQQQKMTGVKTDEGNIKAEHVVLATSLRPAQRLLKEHFQDAPAFRPLFQLPTMPAVTIQMETTRPTMVKDRTTFGPGTCMASFAEQSRTTFPTSNGRLSVILTPPETFLEMKDDQVLQTVVEDAHKLGLDVDKHLVDYRVIRHSDDFHHMGPGYNHLRPEQRTSVQNLWLAGDYTRQPYFLTMEGAALSGVRVAEYIGNTQ